MLSPRSSEQNEKIRIEKIEQILTAAMEVYLEKGLRGTEMGEIAKKAGIARGLVYYYYKDKMALFRELFSRYIVSAQKFIQTSLSSEDEVLSKLKKYTQFYIEMAQNKPELLRFYHNMEGDIKFVFENNSEDVMKDYIHNTHEPLIKTFKQAIEEGKLKKINPKIMVNIYWGALTGTLNVFSNGEVGKEEFELVMNQVIELIFEGLQMN